MKKFLVSLVFIVISLIYSKSYSSSWDFIPIFKITSDKGKIFYIGWTPQGVVMRNEQDGKTRKLVDFLNEDVIDGYEFSSKIKISIDGLNYKYSFEGLGAEQEVRCRLINNGFWLDLVCEGIYTSLTENPFFKSWVITYDGKVLNLEQQTKFVEKNHIKYDTKVLNKRLKEICGSLYRKSEDICEPDSVRIGVNKNGKAILGFVFTYSPKIDLKDLVGKTIWISGYPKNAFDIFKTRYKVERFKN